MGTQVPLHMQLPDSCQNLFTSVWQGLFYYMMTLMSTMNFKTITTNSKLQRSGYPSTDNLTKCFVFFITFDKDSDICYIKTFTQHYFLRNIL